MRSGLPAGYDAWLTTDPAMDADCYEVWETLRRCVCGCWLRDKPDRTEHVENTVREEQYDGTFVDCDYGFARFFYTCKRCKSENTFDDL